MLENFLEALNYFTKKSEEKIYISVNASFISDKFTKTVNQI